MSSFTGSSALQCYICETVCYVALFLVASYPSMIVVGTDWLRVWCSHGGIGKFCKATDLE